MGKIEWSLRIDVITILFFLHEGIKNLERKTEGGVTEMENMNRQGERGDGEEEKVEVKMMDSEG